MLLRNKQMPSSVSSSGYEKTPSDRVSEYTISYFTSNSDE